jgi:hypothetical protein
VHKEQNDDTYVHSLSAFSLGQLWTARN